MFMRMAELVSQRGTCPRAKVGALLVKDRRIVSMGYNGAPPGFKHCTEVGCDIPEDFNANPGCMRTIHGEANAIAFAARYGIITAGTTMYCTYSPCKKCAELLLSAGIIRFVYNREYRAGALDLLDKGLVSIEQLEV
jgi:dCMP deaminase